ncbi:hypothetical protein [Actinocorallia sp. A-T 12471]|uniref:hypothetical protein n=1 Tax=Actinocorallia sp. A-T 12471 TaxID=3089813 RepID=UPI0029CB2A1A|nr:hypothetical protein [Actinocorallia sp. A-T 12471]MDX6741232.1 hypothetical protein [Actinocorallia sp. A-T 12471]
MDDKTLLSLLADDAPDPSPGLADAVVGRARRVRRRRRVSVAASAVVVCAAAVVFPVVWQQGSSVQSDTASQTAAGRDESYSAHSDAPLEGAEKPGPLSDEVAPEGALAYAPDSYAPAYVAALNALPTKRSTPLLILDAFCADPVTCGSTPLPAAFKDALSKLVPSLAFTDDRSDRLAVRIGGVTPSGRALLVTVDGSPIRVWQQPDGSWTAS